MWERPGLHRWVVEFPLEDHTDEFHIETSADGEITHTQFQHELGTFIHPPFPVPNR